jgi:hypothetical protein
MLRSLSLAVVGFATELLWAVENGHSWPQLAAFPSRRILLMREKATQAFQASQIHACRCGSSKSDRPDPDQAERDAHFVARAKAGRERKWEAGWRGSRLRRGGRNYEPFRRSRVPLKKGRVMLNDDPAGLTAPLNSKRPHRQTNALIYSVTRYAQAQRDLFRREVLANQQQAIDLTGRQRISGESVGREHLDALFEIGPVPDARIRQRDRAAIFWRFRL